MSDSRKDEINLGQLFMLFASYKKVLLIWVVAFLIFGVVIKVIIPKDYHSSTSLIYEQGEQVNSGSDILGQIGIPLLGGSSGSSFDIYFFEMLIWSTDFSEYILKKKVLVKGDSITIQEYFGGSEGLVGRLKNIFFNDKDKPSPLDSTTLPTGVTYLEEDKMKIARLITERISITEDPTRNLLTIDTYFSDPYFSALMAMFVKEYLTSKAIFYQTKKTRDELLFVQKQYEIAEENYLATLEKLSKFKDANKNIVASSFTIEEKKLTNLNNVAFQVYNTLSLELEQTKLKLEREKPVFTVLRPPNIPVDDTSPGIVVILIIMVFLGLFSGGLHVIIIYLRKGDSTNK